MFILAASNPFIGSYLESDGFGKAIFWGLFVTSAVCWIVIAYKAWQYWNVRRLSREFYEAFSACKSDPLHLQFSRPVGPKWAEVPHPFFEIYRGVKQQALQILSRSAEPHPRLSTEDLQLVENQLSLSINSAVKKLEKHLFILSTIVTLAPFLGLLGTVWGILLTFSQLHSGLQASNAAMLSGLSMALATTVLGLLIAIPALIGYNSLKNVGREQRREMEEFSHALMTSIELYYRRG
jgi:biopolymer transport protein TolQ